MKSSRLLTLLLLLLPGLAQPWWNEDWKERTVVTLNTSASGVPVQGALSGIAVPVRLHSGNFDFVSAKADGSDLRVLAGDDKTPLKFWVERFDSVNELAVVWVLLPSVLPATDKNVLYVYAGNGKAAADSNGAATADAVTDTGTLGVFHFAEKDGGRRGSDRHDQSHGTGCRRGERPDRSERAHQWHADHLARFRQARQCSRCAPDNFALGATRCSSGNAIPAGPPAIDAHRRQACSQARRDQRQRRQSDTGHVVAAVLTLGGGRMTLYGRRRASGSGGCAGDCPRSDRSDSGRSGLPGAAR